MSHEPEILDAAQCWDLLRGVAVGCVAAAAEGRVVIRPVNYAVDRGTVLIRTGHGSAIADFAGRDAVFEVDGLVESDQSAGPSAAWSVILEGTVRTVSATDELLDTFGVPLFPWHASPKPVFLRLEPESMSGRRFPVVDPGAWRTELDDVRRTATE